MFKILIFQTRNASSNKLAILESLPTGPVTINRGKVKSIKCSLKCSTCHFFGDPSQLPALRAGSFLDEQAIVDISCPLSMLVNNSSRDHMLFTVSSSVFSSQGVDGQTVLDLNVPIVDLGVCSLFKLLVGISLAYFLNQDY